MAKPERPELNRLLVHPEEAAVLLGIRRTRLYRMLGEGALPCVMVDGQKRVPVEALRAWIKSQTIHTESTAKR